jgi:anti-sigma-K factor RskA
MTGLTDCGNIRYALGVYVVGAIDPAERATVDAHLSHCPDCREELAGLAGLPALLGRVPREDAERLALGTEKLEEPPAEMLDSLLAQVTARRRARRWRVIVAAAAAAVIAVGGGIAGGAVMSHDHNAQEGGNTYVSHLARGINANTAVTAAVYYQPKGSGTAMQVEVSGIKKGTHCVFWVINSSGKHLWAGAWTVSGTEDYWYSAASATPIGNVSGFDITGPGGQELVTIPIN